MSDTIEEIREYNPYVLADMAACTCPDSTDSEGAQFLSSVATSFWERWDGGSFEPGSDESDTVHEIADSAPGVYSHTLWMTFVDLGGYQEERPDYADEWPEQMDQIASMVLFGIAERLCYALVEAARDAVQSWECPRCGDNIPPVHCTPDECCDPPECAESDCLHEDGTRGCIYGEEEVSCLCDDNTSGTLIGDCRICTPAEAVHTRPVDLPAVSDPILDLIDEHARINGQHKAPPVDDTAAFIAYMGKVNEEEFGRTGKPFRRAVALNVVWVLGWVLIAGGVAGLIVWGLTR